MVEATWIADWLLQEKGKSLWFCGPDALQEYRRGIGNGTHGLWVWLPREQNPRRCEGPGCNSRGLLGCYR